MQQWPCVLSKRRWLPIVIRQYLRPGVVVHERRITRRNRTNEGLRLATPQCRFAFMLESVSV